MGPLYPGETLQAFKPLTNKLIFDQFGTLVGVQNDHANGSDLRIARTDAVTVSATAATGTVNFDALTQPVLYYTTAASANWTLNIRANSSVSLNALMITGQALTVTHLVTQGATAYYASAVTIDGNAITPKWQGAAPSAGNANNVDAYTFTVIKTADATFTVFASQVGFA